MVKRVYGRTKNGGKSRIGVQVEFQVQGILPKRGNQ